MHDLWKNAKQLTQDFPGNGEFVPWRAVEVRHSILPRNQQMPDREIVERYAGAFDQLPPIKVQAGTLVLIDGLHRMHAAPVAFRDHIRITEAEVSDDELEDEACRANVAHGNPLTTDERKTAARRMFARHHPDTGGTTGIAWTSARIAEWSGAHRNTIDAWRSRDRQRADEAAETGENGHHVAHFVQGQNAPSRVGADGKTYEPRVDRPAATNGHIAASPFPAMPKPEPAPVDAVTQRLARNYTDAAVLFTDYNPAVMERVPRDRRTKQIETFTLWRDWIDEAIAVLRDGA